MRENIIESDNFCKKRIFINVINVQENVIDTKIIFVCRKKLIILTFCSV